MISLVVDQVAKIEGGAAGMESILREEIGARLQDVEAFYKQSLW